MQFSVTNLYAIKGLVVVCGVASVFGGTGWLVKQAGGMFGFDPALFDIGEAAYLGESLVGKGRRLGLLDRKHRRRNDAPACELFRDQTPNRH